MQTLKAVVMVGALALAGPASAQMVNGLAGPNYLHETPIGTKGGGSDASLQAPGESAAIAGALQNEREAKNMQPAGRRIAVVSRQKAAMLSPSRTIARNDSMSLERLKTGQE